MHKSTHSFKIYTPIEAVLMFIFALIGGMGVLFFISKYVVNVFDWHPVIGKALLLIVALSLFGLLQKFTSIELTAEMTDSGISFSGYRTWFGLFKTDKYITWMEITKWKLDDGFTHTETWSPSIFTIKYGNMKKLNLYITDDADNLFAFHSFLDHFDLKIAELNTRNEGIKTIESNEKIEHPKAFALFLSVLALVFIALLVNVFTTDDSWKNDPLWQQIIIFGFLIGMSISMSVLAFKAVKKAI